TGALPVRDVRDDEILVGREPEIALVDAGELAQAREHAMLPGVLYAAGRHEQRQVPAPVAGLLPAEAVAAAGELVRLRRREREAEPPVQLVLEPVEAAVVDRVLEPRVLAIGAVPEIALHADDVLGDGERLLDGAEADDVADARVGRGLAVGRAHA